MLFDPDDEAYLPPQHDVPDPLADAAKNGSLTLASWRVFRFPDLHQVRPALVDLLMNATAFEDDVKRRHLAAALRDDPAALRAVGAALLTEQGPSDLAWSWIAVAGLSADPIAAQAVVRTLVRRAQWAPTGVARHLWRVARSWAPHVPLTDPTATGRSSDRLRQALDRARRVERDEPPRPPDRDQMPADTHAVIRGTIPATTRDERQLAEAWKALTKPLPLARGPAPDVLETVLKAEFPWLHDAVDAMVGDLKLRAWAGQPWLKWRPILLLGPPGTGKTRLAQRLAQLSGAGFGQVNAAGSSDNRLLAGTARGWGSSSPAQVLHVIRACGHANPVMLVDELDKERSDGRNGSVRDTLLTMLEGRSAQAWPDECLLVDCDLSQVNWIACANDATPLRGPLLSRLRIIDAPPPGPEHIDAITFGILRDLAAELGVAEGDLPPLSPPLIARLETALANGTSVRRLRLAIESSLRIATVRPRRVH